MALTNDFKVKNGLTVTDSISAGSCIEADSFEKHGGTSSQFLKADGSVDSSAYTTCCGDVTGIDAGTAITVTDGNTATPQVAVNSTCNSTWNAKTTCTGTVTNVVGCDGITVNNGTGCACVCVDSTVVKTTGGQTIGPATTNFQNNICVGGKIYSGSNFNTLIEFGSSTIDITSSGGGNLAVNSTGIGVTGNIVVSGTVDGVDVAALATCSGLTKTGTVTCVNTGTGLTGGVISTTGCITLNEATATARGGIELFSNTDQSVAANSVSSTAGRTYGIQLNSDGQAVVNVPWSNTNSGGTVTSQLQLVQVLVEDLLLDLELLL